MAQFRATIRGQRGSASRLGNIKSGLVAVVNGWHGGVRVEAMHNANGDWFNVFATSGSNATRHDKFLGHVDENGNWLAVDRV